MHRDRPVFPDPRSADEDGLVAVTTELNTGLLLEAYGHGIFPWSEDPVRWYSPDPRAIFLRDRIHLPRRLDRIMRKQQLRVTFDLAFAEVMRCCAATHWHEGVWITPGFVRAYGELHRAGYAHSVEVWQGDQMVGGLYGVQLGGLFAGESMFHLVPNASKVAFAHLVAQLDVLGTVLFDCQVINDHTARLGAVCVSRDDYLEALPIALQVQCRYAGEKWPTEPPPPPRRRTSGGGDACEDAYGPADEDEGEYAPGDEGGPGEDGDGDCQAGGEDSGEDSAADGRVGPVVSAGVSTDPSTAMATPVGTDTSICVSADAGTSESTNANMNANTNAGEGRGEGRSEGRKSQGSGPRSGPQSGGPA